VDEFSSIVFVSPTHPSNDLEDFSEVESNCHAEILLLTESDIPGASLNGKDPRRLNLTQLKRWLSCRGAPVTGKKPELIER